MFVEDNGNGNKRPQEKLTAKKTGSCCTTGEKGELCTVDGIKTFLAIVGAKYLAFGLVSSFPVLFVEFLDKFEESHAITSLLIAIQLSAFYMFGMVSGIIISIFGHRLNIAFGTILSASGIMITSFLDNIIYVMIVFGLLLGFGCSCLITSSESGPLTQFKVHRALAASLSMCATGLAQATAPILTSALIKTFALKGTLWILSGVVLNGLVFALLFTSIAKKHVDTKEIDLERDKTNNNLTSGISKKLAAIKEICIRRPLFWLIFIMFCAFDLANDGSRGFLVDRCLKWGMKYDDGVVIVSIWGLASTIVRLVVPVLNTPLARIWCVIIVYPLWGVMQILSMFMNKFWSMAIFGGTSGLATGATGVVIVVMISDITPTHQITLFYGFLISLLGMSYLTMIPLSGKLYDVTKSYDIVYSIYGTLCITTGLLGFYFLFLYKRMGLSAKAQPDNQSEQFISVS